VRRSAPLNAVGGSVRSSACRGRIGTNILAVLSTLGVRVATSDAWATMSSAVFIVRRCKDCRRHLGAVNRRRARCRRSRSSRSTSSATNARFCFRGARHAAVPRAICRTVCSTVRGCFCIDGSQPALQAAVAEKARAKGVTVLLKREPTLLAAWRAAHPFGHRGGLRALCPTEPPAIAPSEELADSLREITRLGPRIAVITMGEAGAVALEGTKLVQQDAIDVFVEDTTGAGDAFCGAFAYAQPQGLAAGARPAFANAAAGLACRSLGSRSGLPTVDEVTDAMKRG